MNPMSFPPCFKNCLFWEFLPTMSSSAGRLPETGTLLFPSNAALRYSGRHNPLIVRKTIFSILLLISDIVIMAALIVKPSILQHPSGMNWIVPALIFLCLPLASIIGEHGGRLVFPVLKSK